MIVAAALAVAPVPAATERVVNFYNWSDYIDPTVIDDFSRQTGIKVRYDTFDSNDTLEAKLLAGKSGYDVVVPTAYFLARQIAAGIFQKLDKAKLPNLANVWPEIADRLARYDPGNQYAVNYMWGTTGIGYNVKAAREILGPDARHRLLGRRVRSRPDRSVQGLRHSPARFIRRHHAGGAALSASRSEFERSGRSAEGRRPSRQNQAVRVRKFHSSEYLNALATGEICFVVGFSGDIKQAQKRAARSQGRHRDRLRDPEGRRAIVVRQSRHSGATRRTPPRRTN